MQDAYLRKIKSTYQTKNPSFPSLFDPLATTSAYYDLRTALTNIPTLRPSSFTSLAKTTFPDPDDKPLADLCATYLLYVRDIELDSEDGEMAAKAYGMMEDCFKSIDKLFSYQDAAWLVPTLRKFTTALVELGLKAGRLTGNPKLPQASSASRLFRRPMTIASSDRSETPPSKRLSLFHLANSTFRIYFALRNLRLCDTVLNSTNGVLHLLENKDPRGLRIGASDVCTFRYYRGRLYLYQRRLPQARQELLSAFALCHQDAYHNGRLILTYLIAASLPLGIFPTEELLEQFDLVDQYGMLIMALQMGDYRTVLSALDENESWHRGKGNYLLLKEKLYVICWRNLFRRTLFVVHSGNPQFDKTPPTLSLQAVLTTARISFLGLEEGEPELDLDDVESIACSLIDQGYIKGYINSNRGVIVLQRGEQMGFPPIVVVNA